MPEEFHRIKRLPPYVFAEVNALKAEARAQGRDVIDLGMGNPDGPTPPHIVAKLVECVQNPKTHGYSTSRGIAGLRRAQAAYYARRFNVELDPEREVIVTLGSKEGLANLAQAITAPGDTILVPNPCYPIHAFGFIMTGALGRVKSYLDYGAFTPIQVAATAALNGPQECIGEIRERYRARRDVLIDGLRQAGWEVPPPAASMFTWAPIPEQFRGIGTLAFSKLLLERANVAVAPGVGFGEYGEGFVRIALVENRQRLRQATRNIKSFLAGRNDTPELRRAAQAAAAK